MRKLLWLSCLIFLSACSEQKVKFPKCEANQTADFVVYQPPSPDGGRNAAIFRTYTCENGKWKLQGSFAEGRPIAAEEP